MWDIHKLIECGTSNYCVCNVQGHVRINKSCHTLVPQRMGDSNDWVIPHVFTQALNFLATALLQMEVPAACIRAAKLLERAGDARLSHVWHALFICATWLLHMCDMNYSCVIWLIHVWHDLSYVWRDLFICVAWLIYVEHDLFMCNMTQSYA